MRVLVVALLLACGVARADTGEYIVFVGTDAELVTALELVMQGTNAGVKPIGERPTPSLAELGPESRRLADEHRAAATVWLSPTAAGATLVTYERTADRFVVREVPYRLPLDTTQAFETARMVRVMLRAVRDRNDEDAVTRRLRARPITGPPAPQLAASVGGGAWFGSPESTATPIASITLAWRPYGIGAAITAMIAPATELEQPMFAGDVSVWRVAAEARLAVELAPRVRLTPALGLSLHHVALAGQLGATETVSSRRFNPAAQIGSILGIALPHRVELQLAISGDYLLRRQRYTIGTQEFLSVPSIQAMMAILVGIRL